jgi:hypothetical protein
MTERVAKPRGRKKKEATRAGIVIPLKTEQDAGALQCPGLPKIQPGRKASAVDMPVPNPMFPTDRRHPEDVERAVTAIRYQYRPPTFYQPAKVHPEALDTAFLAHYVQLNSGNKTYSPEIQWLNHLPRIHATATKPAVKLSLRAVSMAFYAKLHHDQSILVDSWRWYSVSLSAQRMSIAKLRGDDIPEEGEVLVPLILALYEVYCGTSGSGALMHLGAAAKMMNMRGPSNCRTGAIWPLFKGIRNADVSSNQFQAHRSIVFGKPSIYSSPEWMTIPFIDMPRDAHQRLADISLMIPVCIQMLQIEGSLRVFFETPISPYVDVESSRELTIKLLGDLDDWAARYPNLTNISKDPQDILQVSNRSGKGLDIANEDLSNPHLPDTFIALIASNFVSTKLLLNMIMYKIATQARTPPSTPASTTAEYFDQATRCAKAILRGAAIVENAQTSGFDLLRSISPLVTVVCAGPGEEQFREAKAMLHRWGARIGGLSSIMDAHILSSKPTKSLP